MREPAQTNRVHRSYVAVKARSWGLSTSQRPTASSATLERHTATKLEEEVTTDTLTFPDDTLEKGGY